MNKSIGLTLSAVLVATPAALRAADKDPYAGCLSSPPTFVQQTRRGKPEALTLFSLDLDAKEPTTFVALQSQIANEAGLFHVFSQEGNCYRHIGLIQVAPGALEVTKSKHHGLRDFKTYVNGALVVYRFDGHSIQKSSEKAMPPDEMQKKLTPSFVIPVRIPEPRTKSPT
jgi:hypothetical protein